MNPHVAFRRMHESSRESGAESTMPDDGGETPTVDLGPSLREIGSSTETLLHDMDTKPWTMQC